MMNTRIVENTGMMEPMRGRAHAGNADAYSLPESVPLVWREHIRLWRWIRVAVSISSGFALLVAVMVALAHNGTATAGQEMEFAYRMVMAAGWFVLTWGFTLLMLLPVVRLLQAAVKAN